MEDPWSTPWAADTPSASPGLTPVKPAQPAQSAADHANGGLGIHGFGALESSPWGGAANGFAQADTAEDDEWGGFDDGKDNAWGDTKDGLGEGKTEDGFAPPWGEAREGTTDSAVSFGERHVRNEESEKETKNAMGLLADEQDAWATVEETPTIIEPTTIEHDEPTPEIADEIPSGEEESINIEPATTAEPEELKASEASGEDAASEDSEPVAVVNSDGDSTPVEQKSSKVKELVTRYDGIAKDALRPPPDTLPREPRRRVSTDVEDPMTPIEDDQKLENDETQAEPDIETEVVSESAEGFSDDVTNEAATEATAPAIEADSASESITQSSSGDTAEAIETQDESEVDEVANDANNEIHDNERTTEAQNDTASPPKASQTIPYPIDFSNLDALFPGSSPSTTHPEPVPDVIIDNSFSTTSERKHWWRISRFGSTRRHDSADEDSYRRITWATSEIRTQTLHTVRRWMEEDSIAGRVVLGSRKAGPLGASMFGWDSSEPQVEIGELLRQRVQKNAASGHSRNKSLPQQEAPPQTPTMDTFGWGASVPSTPSAVVQSPAFAAQMKARAGSALRPPDSPASIPKSPWDEDEAPERKSAELMPPPPTPAVNGNKKTTAQTGKFEDTQPPNENEDEDDDDWGEMMTSPTVESSAGFGSLSAAAEINPTPPKPTFDADFGGMDFFEDSASKKSIDIQPTTQKMPNMARANPPPPIQTSGILKSEIKAPPSPIWTPSMSTPVLEPTRVSISSNRPSAVGTPTMASTPVVELTRASMDNGWGVLPKATARSSMEMAWSAPPKSANKTSMEVAWTAPKATSRTSMELSWDAPAATPEPASKENARAPPTARTRTSMEMAWEAPATPKEPKRVSFEDTCTVDQGAVDAALRNLPDLSYMLR